MTEPSLSQLLAAINSVDTSVRTLKDETNANFVVLKAEFATTTAKADANERRIEEIVGTQELLTYEIEMMKQRQLAHNICITGIPTAQDENPFELLLKIATALRVDISSEDIRRIYRLRSSPSNAIICQFEDERTKYNFLKAKAEHKELLVVQIGFRSEGQISINHQLTPYFSSLLYMTRQAVKANQIVSGWFSKRGVFIKPLGANAEPILIKTKSQMEANLPLAASNAVNHKRKPSVENPNDPKRQNNIAGEDVINSEQSERRRREKKTSSKPPATKNTHSTTVQQSTKSSSKTVLPSTSQQST